ncbi:MAG TPA: ABC transporter permease [Candidatus Hydrogenedentes bacterium]|nr:MAG: Teichoic acid translocation permease protein TagG [Candidatus Hydrogenedentes bacterium ADurb.Bin170]HNZ47502.1 ABC transporter permease [Candidatus Hydrogenedentota bacterium]HOD95948.1 ABC transporter permease [Candidatus Hydrogenedentota bacterium]HOH42703.1 ABC transporter permease [Candidatus Hydrogenedentota bacterium]HOM48990.1 ABC transporter permease [Candidatus Hydrogenedentota bacterium]
MSAMRVFTYDSLEERRPRHILMDLIRARQLLLDLIWRDLRVRYRYAVMGFLWAVLEPLAFTVILTLVFTLVFAPRVPDAAQTAGPPYVVMLLCGIIFWQYFSTSVTTATTSVVANQNLVKKVRFTREIIPMAACCVPLVQLGIGLTLLFIVHLFLGGALSSALIWLPFVFAIQFVLTLGLALLFSCVHVHFRDVSNVVTVGLLLGFYASPIFYPLEMVRESRLPQWLQQLYLLNPMAGLLTAYRQILLEYRFPDWQLLIAPSVIAVSAFIAGLLLFRRIAATMSDYL